MNTIKKSSIIIATATVLCASMVLLFGACGVIVDPHNNTSANSTYTCADGIAVNGMPDGNEDIEQCQKCNVGYRLDNERCVPNRYVCNNGTAVAATDNEKPHIDNEVEKCSECDSGYLFNSDTLLCELNISFVCDNGFPADGATAATAGTTKCSDCRPGYTLIGVICVDDNELPTEFISVSFDGTDTEMQQISTQATIDEPRTIQLSVDPGQTDLSSLFFQFTNTNQQVSSIPKVRISSGIDNIVQTDGEVSSSVHSHGYSHGGITSNAPHHAHATSEFPIPQSIHLPAPELSAPPATSASVRGFASAPLSAVGASPPAVKLGDSRSFRLHQIGQTATLYARAVRTIGEWSVIAWVHPDVYTGCSGNDCLAQLLSQSDVDAMMDAFFIDGNDNDIFDWVTALIGVPWGEHDYDGDLGERNRLISGDTRTINIILSNIDNQGYETPAIVGYFYSGDAYRLSYNQALTLFLHAPWAKFNTTNTRRQDSFYYSFLSALAHEFQHLVHYYQRVLRLKVNAPSWLNEQYSLIIEEIVSQKIFGTDPHGFDDRGVNGLSAGTYPICYGRVPDFTEQSYYGISRWGYSKTKNEPLVNYAVNYSFANFLLRNYNGAAYLVSSYAHNGDPIASIEAGLNGDTFADAVTKWGTALLLSDSTDAPEGYRVNNGDDGFTYTYNGVEYEFGSTNYYNYGVENGAGGCSLSNASGIFKVSNNTERLRKFLDDEQHGHSNILYEAGTDVSGAVQFVITLPVGSRLTVVARRHTNSHNPVYF